MYRFLTSFLFAALLSAGAWAQNTTTENGVPVYVGPPLQEFFRVWLVCGPFPNPLPPGLTQYRHDSTSLGFYRDYLAALGGESKVAPREGQAVRRPDGRLVRWRRIRSFFPQVVLDDVFTPNDSSVAYAACVVRTDRARDVVLALSANDGVRVWQNGRLILDRNMPGTDEPDRDYLPVHLHRGDNLFLLKISEGFGRWGFHFRFLSIERAREAVETGLPHFLSPTVVRRPHGWNVTLGRVLHVELLPDRPFASLEVLSPDASRVEFSASAALGDTVFVPEEGLSPGEHFVRVAIQRNGQTLSQLGWLYKGSAPSEKDLLSLFRKMPRPSSEDLSGWARLQVWKCFDFHLSTAAEEGNVPAFYRVRTADVLARYCDWATEPGSIYARVLPSLKQVRLRRGEPFRLEGTYWTPSGSGCKADLARFLDTVKRRHGINLRPASDVRSARLVFGTLGDAIALRLAGFKLPTDVPNREAYWIQIASDRILVVGASEAGLHNALVTCRWLADLAAAWPAAEIADWPAYPLRSAYIHLDENLPEAEIKRLLTFVDLKYNAISFASSGFYRLSDVDARSRLQKVVSFLRRYHVEPIPYVALPAGKDGREGVYLRDEPVRFVQGRAKLPVERLLDLPSTHPLLASAPVGDPDRVIYQRGVDWDVSSVEPPVLVALGNGRVPRNGTAYLTADIVDRREHRYVKACPSEESVYVAHERASREVIQTFHPKAIHLGHDEVGLVKGDSRCIRTGLPGYRLFANQLTRAFRDVTRVDSSVAALLWADSVNPFHNAGKKELDRTADYLPRGLIMAHWFYGANGPEDVNLIDKGAAFFLKRGFRVVGCPWDDPANHQLWEQTLARYRLRDPGVLGVMHTEWDGRDAGKVL
ncbi:MAG TPA: hypothetical protein ENK07_05845, partial [Bacteroidetes bacterium]|nr:hypothetical protein [Bacteroidota bacterium]